MITLDSLSASVSEGYTNNRQYLSDLLELTAYKISNHKKKPELEKMQDLIEKKLQSSYNKKQFSFVLLKERFSLTSFQKHCILIALLYEIQLKNNLPTVQTAKDSFEEIIDFLRIRQELSVEFCQCFFGQYKINFLWEMPLVLSSFVRNYLFSKQIVRKDNFLCFFSTKKEVSFHTEKIKNICKKSPFGTAVNIFGRKKSGRFYQIRTVCSHFAEIVIVFSIMQLFQKEESFWQTTLYDLLCQARLCNAAICVCDLELFEKEKSNRKKICLNMVFSFFHKYFPFFFLITEENYHFTDTFEHHILLIHYGIEELSKKEQLKFWELFTQDFSVSNKDFIQLLVNKYHFNAGEIKNAVKKATLLLSSGNLNAKNEKILEKACQSSCEKLHSLGTHCVVDSYTWDDLILEKEQKFILKHACNYIKLSHIVYENWGYNQKLPYGCNLSILMEGASGTGKTMAAQVIANELGLLLYKVDIAKTVSKYIGETEKKLNEIFDEAEHCHAILFIDEMDTFFGKRTEIKDSHDKYANIETSFLLQKLESYKGILLLATNYLKNIDEAFVRRIKFIVHFTLPNEENRKNLWCTMFPKEAPKDEAIDFDFLAKNFPLSGGTIKNIVLKSAFLAASQNKEITMKHILKALQEELTKQGKVVLPSDFGKYRHFISK